MIENKRLNIMIALLMLLAVVGTAWLMLSPPEFMRKEATEPEYVSQLFVEDEIIAINIDIDPDDFEWLLTNATREEYRSCDITVNGTTYYNVGLRPKGNSSLNMVASDDDSDRFSFKVNFDAYVEGQTCFGLNKLALNNIIMDNTYMKEYLAYEMFAYMGVATPLYGYASISVNGEPWGLYLAVESMEESFVKRAYGSLAGHLYRPEGSGSDLQWKGDDSANYAGIKNMAAYDVSDTDFQKIITMIENLNSGTDLEKYLDVDAILRYFAVNTFLVNFDSYTGNLKHNYYLYEEDGVCTILPWDFNLAFAGHEINDAAKAVNHPIDTPVTVNLSERPLIAKLLEVPEYKELYHQYLGQLVEDYVDSGAFAATVEKLDNLINDAVKNDPSSFTTYADYETSLPVLVEFARLRGESIQAQLSGQQPSTQAGQEQSPETAVDAGAIDLSLLGGMGGGRGGPREMGDRGAMEAPEGMQPPGGMGGMEPPGGGFPGGDSLDPETMLQIREILQATGDNELTSEQIAQLRELGLDATMIERMQNMPADMEGRPGGEPGGMPPDSSALARLQPIQIAYIAVSAACLLLGLLFVWRYKRRKYHS